MSLKLRNKLSPFLFSNFKTESTFLIYLNKLFWRFLHKEKLCQFGQLLFVGLFLNWESQKIWYRKMTNLNCVICFLLDLQEMYKTKNIVKELDLVEVFLGTFFFFLLNKCPSPDQRKNLFLFLFIICLHVFCFV